MRLHSLHRFPVKAMAGESLDQAHTDLRGLVGDRAFAVTRRADGRFVTGKNSRRFTRNDAIFGFAARTEGDEVVVRRNRREWLAGDPALDRTLSESLGEEVSVSREGAVPHFDDGAISVVGTASLDWCRENLGIDQVERRIRANLVVQTRRPFEEETWDQFAVGDCLLRCTARITRCRVVDLAQNGVTDEAPLLRGLGRTRETRLGVYAEVVTPAILRVAADVRGVAAGPTGR